jgi:hypothetical protein
MQPLFMSKRSQLLEQRLPPELLENLLLGLDMELNLGMHLNLLDLPKYIWSVVTTFKPICGWIG